MWSLRELLDTVVSFYLFSSSITISARSSALGFRGELQLVPWFWIDLDQAAGKNCLFLLFYGLCVCIRKGWGGFLNGTVLFPLICLPPYVVLSSAWWLLHGPPLWIENKICRNPCCAMKAKGILKKLFFFFLVQKLCFTQEHHLLDVTSLHFWEYCGRVKFCLKGTSATEKRRLVNPCLLRDLLSSSI